MLRGDRDAYSLEAFLAASRRVAIAIRATCEPLLAIAAVLLFVGCAAPSSAQQQSSSPVRTAEPAPSEPPPPFEDPWLAYNTAVNPGSGIQFTSLDRGWRVDGQDGAPHLDASLAAGPKGTAISWPGSAVSVSDDGGQTWSAVFDDSNGIWGIDALSDEDVWAIGVTSLSRTNDGGASWQRVGEPQQEPLVSVDFVSRQIGYGLTTNGLLVQSSDGGDSWTSGSLTSRGAALCFVSEHLGYVSDEKGDVFTTDDGGATWVKTGPSPLSANLAPYWSQLSCNELGVWQGIRVLDSNAHVGQPFVVRFGADQGTGWTTLAAASPDPGFEVPTAEVPIEGLDTIIAGPAGLLSLIGLPTSRWGLQLERVDSAGRTTDSASPRLSATAPVPEQTAGYLVVHGGCFVGSKGWIFLNNNAVGTPEEPGTQAVVLASGDGGQTWTVLDTDAVHPPAPLSFGSSIPVESSGGTESMT